MKKYFLTSSSGEMRVASLVRVRIFVQELLEDVILGSDVITFCTYPLNLRTFSIYICKISHLQNQENNQRCEIS